MAGGQPGSAWALSGDDGGDVLCPATAPRRGGMVLLHAGAFYIGAYPYYLRAFCAPWAAAGFDVVAVQYPVGDLPAAQRHVRRSAATLRATLGGQPLVAYGESAGGTWAVDLSVRGQVDAAVAIAPPTNLLAWSNDNTHYWHDLVHASRVVRREASPLFHVTRRATPLLLLHSPTDTSVPYRQSVALVRADPSAQLARLRGTHLTDSTAAPRALRWLRRFAPSNS